MSQNSQNFAKFQEFQLDNLVDFEKAVKRIFTCKNRCRYSRKRATCCQNFAKNFGNTEEKAPKASTIDDELAEAPRASRALEAR